MNAEGPQPLIEAVQHFSDPQVCHAYMVKLKWPDGVIRCSKCNGDPSLQHASEAKAIVKIAVIYCPT